MYPSQQQREAYLLSRATAASTALHAYSTSSGGTTVPTSAHAEHAADSSALRTHKSHE
jgi:hypothetical protein